MHSHDLRWHLDDDGTHAMRCRMCGVDGALSSSVKCPYARVEPPSRKLHWLVATLVSLLMWAVIVTGCTQ